MGTAERGHLCCNSCWGNYGGETETSHSLLDFHGVSSRPSRLSETTLRGSDASGSESISGETKSERVSVYPSEPTTAQAAESRGKRGAIRQGQDGDAAFPNSR